MAPHLLESLPAPSPRRRSDHAAADRRWRSRALSAPTALTLSATTAALLWLLVSPATPFDHARATTLAPATLSPAPLSPTACRLDVTRDLGIPDERVEWGDELSVRVAVDVRCDAGQEGARLRVTEELPDGMAPIPGMGTPPASFAGGAITWVIEGPVAGRRSIAYRVAITPPGFASGIDAPVRLAWTVEAELTLDDGTTVLATATPPALTVTPRQRCRIAWRRSATPELVAVRDPVRLTLDIVPVDCIRWAQRTLGLLIIQPVASPAALGAIQAASRGVLRNGTPRDSAFGAVYNALPPSSHPPTSATGLVDAFVAGIAPSAVPGADAVAALDHALAALPEWPYHRRVAVYVTHAGAPAADPDALAARLAALAERHVAFVAVCVGGGCDAGLPYAGSLPDYAGLEAELPALVAAHRGPSVALATLDAYEVLYGFVQADAGSAVPGATLDAGGVRWTGLPARVNVATRVSIAVRSTAIGTLPHGRGATVDLVFDDGARDRINVPPGLVATSGDAEAPRCSVAPEAAVAPGRVPLGDPVEVMLRVGMDCPGVIEPAQVMLALDVSGSMGGVIGRRAKLLDLKDAAATFLDIVAPAAVPVGIVAFNGAVVAEAGLTTDYDRLRALVDGLETGGGTNIAAGLDAASRELASAPVGPLPIVVVMTDGNDAQPERTVVAAEVVKRQGALVVVLCFGTSCDPSMEVVATDPRYRLELADGTELHAFFRDLGLRLRRTQLDRLRVTSVLAPNVHLLPGSIDPAPLLVAGRTIVWELAAADGPLAEPAFRYRLEPLLVGQQALHDEARAQGLDDEGRRTEARFPPLEAETWLPPPSGPCAVTADKRAAPNVVPVDGPVGVIITLAIGCPPRDAGLDVVLALDHSASMAGYDRLTNARTAVDRFLDALDPTQVRVGLVTFSDSVTARVPVTGDYTAVRAAVARLRPEGQTSVAVALAASGELLAGRPDGAGAATLLLTDGVNTAGSAPMLAAAATLRAAGVHVATVCAGGRCDPALPDVASSPDAVFDVPDGDAIIGLFDQLARRLAGVLPYDVVLVDAFPAGVAVDPTSFSPLPDDNAPDGVAWRWPLLPAEGVTLTYTVRPQLAGRLPVNRGAVVTYRFGLGERGRAVLPVPEIRAMDAAPPTASPTPASPTPPAPTATAPWTPSPPRYAVHLPIASHGGVVGLP